MPFQDIMCINIYGLHYVEILQSPKEGHQNDPYAVAVLKDTAIVGHAPCELCLVFSYSYDVLSQLG